MNMPGRKFDAGSGYRYGFNGKEKSDEVYGEGNVYDYGFRIYNPRIGKFLSVDPLFKGFPWNSPYSYAEGDVMRCIDLDGLEKAVFIDEGTIEIQMVVVAFTSRPSKVIEGKTYSGGNLPLGFTPNLAVKVYERAYEEVNAGLNGKEFPLDLIEKEDPELAKTLYKGAEPGCGDDSKKYKIRYNAKLLVFSDEEEMRNSEEFKAADANGTFSGFQLYGSESYAIIGAGQTEEIPIILKKDAAAQSFGAGSTRNKAKLIRTFDESPSSTNSGLHYAMSRTIVVHEDGHQLGVQGHIGDGDPIKDDVIFTDGQRYNGIGMMKYENGSRNAEAPFTSQVAQMLSWIRFEKPKNVPNPHTESTNLEIEH